MFYLSVNTRTLYLPSVPELVTPDRLLLFPFFEPEFDIVEVVASSVFGDDDSADSDDGEGEESDSEA